MRKQYTDTTSHSKIAVITKSNLSFGLARMFESFSHNVPFNFEIFQAMDAALSWLGVSEKLLDDIEQDNQ